MKTSENWERLARRMANGAMTAFIVVIVALVWSIGRRMTRPDVVDVPNDAQIEEAPTPEALAGLTAEQLLKEVVDAYANAKFYSDDGYVEIEYERDNDPEPRSYREPCALTFAKPNCARARFGAALIQFDGARGRAEILDEDYVDQVLEFESPLVLTSIKEFYPDPRFAEAAELRVPSNFFWTSPALILLLAKDPLKTLAPPGSVAKLLEPAFLRYVDDESEPAKVELCDRVQIAYDDGVRVYWIARETRALARCELPPEGVRAPESGARIASLRIDFPNLTLSAAAASSFDEFKLEPLAETPGLRRVERFLPPEIAALDREWPVDALKTALESDVDAPFELERGVESTLYFWSVHDLDRTAAFQALDDFARRYPDERYVAVNVDGRETSDARARADASASGLTCAFARLDRSALLRAAIDFPIPRPGWIAQIDESGVVARYARTGGSIPRLRRALARANQGGDPATEDRNAYFSSARAFEGFAASAAARDVYRVVSELETPPDALPRMNPKRFGLREAWRCDSLHAPCNPIAFSGDATLDPAESAERSDGADAAALAPLARRGRRDYGSVVVPCDGNAIATISPDGRVRRTTTPAAAISEPITVVRSCDAPGGERFFLAFAPLQSRKIHRFDANFIDLGSLDAGKMGDLWASDARFSDLDGDGSPEALLSLVGSSGGRSSAFCAVDMKSLRILRRDDELASPSCVGATSLALGADGSERRVALALELTEGGRGAFVAIDWETGERRRFPATSSDDSVLRFAIADPARFPNATTRIVALVAARDSLDLCFVGFDASGVETFRRPIANVEWDSTLEQIVSGDLDEDGRDEWLVASPNGAAHIFDADGKPVDYFQYGSRVTGLCVARWNGATHLIATSEDRVSAWKVEPRRNRREIASSRAKEPGKETKD